MCISQNKYKKRKTKETESLRSQGFLCHADKGGGADQAIADKCWEGVQKVTYKADMISDHSLSGPDPNPVRMFLQYEVLLSPVFQCFLREKMHMRNMTTYVRCSSRTCSGKCKPRSHPHTFSFQNFQFSKRSLFLHIKLIGEVGCNVGVQ